MEYTAVIRTLGMAGDKFQKELDSLINQTIKPKGIIVYIAEGYAIPKETCGLERYVYVKKGMVAQRALTYKDYRSDRRGRRHHIQRPLGPRGRAAGQRCRRILLV